MNDTILFSVVIPVFNRSSKLLRALMSVSAQTYQNFEVIVVDDGSRAEVATEIAHMIENLSDERFRLIVHQTNQNGAAARNTGMKSAKGEFLCLLDSDDRWHPTKLAKVKDCIEGIALKDEIVIHHQYCNSAGGKLSDSMPAKAKLKNESVAHYSFVKNKAGGIQSSTICVSKKLALKALFNEKLRGHQDWDFALKLGAMTDNFYFIAEPLTTRFQDSEDSVVNSLDWQYSLWFYSQVSEFFSANAALYYFQRVILARAQFTANFSKLFLNELFLKSFCSNPYTCVKLSVQFLHVAVKHRARLKNVAKICRERQAQQIIIWGANNYARSLISYLQTQYPIVAILDSSASGANKYFMGINLKTIRSITKKDLLKADAIILATDKHEQSMRDELIATFPQCVENVIRF